MITTMLAAGGKRARAAAGAATAALAMAAVLGPVPAAAHTAPGVHGRRRRQAVPERHLGLDREQLEPAQRGRLATGACLRDADLRRRRPAGGAVRRQRAGPPGLPQHDLELEREHLEPRHLTPRSAELRPPRPLPLPVPVAEVSRTGCRGRRRTWRARSGAAA